jgi:hypothetical protein
MKRLIINIIIILFLAVFVMGCPQCALSTSKNISPTIPKDISPTTSKDVSPNVSRDASPAASIDTSLISDSDHDGITDAIETQLMEKFAPIVKLHPEEKYQPADIEWYLERVRMRFEINKGFDDSILKKGEVNTSSLTKQSNKGQTSGLTATSTNFFLEQTDLNGGDSLDNYRESTRQGLGVTNSNYYAHIRFAPHGYDVQYIFFYAYNGDLLTGPLNSSHEADIEHVTVRVENDLKTITKIYFAAHDNEGKWYQIQPPSQNSYTGYSLTPDGRPIVFSALNSHASYPWAGKWARGRGMPDDQTSDTDTFWDCQKSVKNLGEKEYPGTNMHWIQYSGRMGEIGSQSWTTGPNGPAYQSWWNFDPE